MNCVCSDPDCQVHYVLWPRDGLILANVWWTTDGVKYAQMVARVIGTILESLFDWSVLSPIVVEMVIQLRDGCVHCGASHLALLTN